MQPKDDDRIYPGKVIHFNESEKLLPPEPTKQCGGKNGCKVVCTCKSMNYSEFKEQYSRRN